MHPDFHTELPTVVQLSRLQFQLMHQFLNTMNIYPGQYHVLHLLSHHSSGTNQKNIAQHLFIKPSSVNQILVKLEELEYITRSPDKNDKRMINVQLTEKGLEILKEADKKFKHIQSVMEKDISKEDLKKFDEIAKRMKQNLLQERKGECPRCH